MISMPSQNDGMARPETATTAHGVVDPGVAVERRDGAERDGDQDRRSSPAMMAIWKETGMRSAISLLTGFAGPQRTCRGRGG